jgi:Rrf2 family protein
MLVAYLVPAGAGTCLELGPAPYFRVKGLALLEGPFDRPLAVLRDGLWVVGSERYRVLSYPGKILIHFQQQGRECAAARGPLLDVQVEANLVLHGDQQSPCVASLMPQRACWKLSHARRLCESIIFEAEPGTDSTAAWVSDPRVASSRDGPPAEEPSGAQDSLKFKRAAGHALHVLTFLAERSGYGPVPLRAIAWPEDAPGRSVLDVLRDLTAAGLLHRVRGRRGGYSLSRTPAEISLLEVIEATGRPIRGQVSNLGGEGAAFDSQLEAAWRMTAELVRSELQKVSLEDLLGMSTLIARGSVP